MSGEVDGSLVELLRVHVSHISYVPPQGVWNSECLGCDWRDYGETGGGPAAAGAHATHLAHAVQEWADRRADERVAEALEGAAERIDVLARLASGSISGNDDLETVMAMETYQHAARIVREQATR